MTASNELPLLRPLDVSATLLLQVEGVQRRGLPAIEQTGPDIARILLRVEPGRNSSITRVGYHPCVMQ